MLRSERVTTSRGRSDVPVRRLRTRKWRRALPIRRAPALPPWWWRLISVALMLKPSLLAGLSSLAADDLALVLHALALVRLRRTDLADVRGDLAHLLLVDARHVEQRGALDGEGDPLGGLHDDRVAEAQRELQVAALGGDAVAGAGDLQGLP